MTTKAPEFEIRVADGARLENAEAAVDYIQATLSTRLGWQGREGGAGKALVYLFGRLVELTFNRVNQVPENHFLAFLNEAGIDRLPPRAADWI